MSNEQFYGDMDPSSELNVAVNYAKVAAATEFPAIIRMTALMIQQNSYMTLGDFFKGLNDDDVRTLQEMVETAETDSNSIMHLVLLSEMLSRAEGSGPETINDATKNLNSLCAFITCASLARKGLVRVFYENFSFGADMDSANIVQKL